MARVDHQHELKSLFILIKDGSTLDVRTFLETHDRSDREMKWQGMSALGYAVAKRKVKVVQMLLDLDVNVNIRGDGEESGLCPIHYLYVREHEIEKEKRVFPKDSKIRYRKPLTKKALIIADLLIKAGASLNVFFDDSSSQNSDVYPPLIFAAKSNDISFAKFLLDNEVDAECRKFTSDKLDTPLFYAAKRGYKDMVKLLVSKGAQINPREGKLPLIGSSNNLEMTELLLSYGANPNHFQSCYPQDFPLTHALMHGNINCVLALAKRGIKDVSYHTSFNGILDRLRRVRSLPLKSIRFLVCVHKYRAKDLHGRFGKLSVSVGSKDPQQYRLFPAILDGGLDLLKCENIEEILYVFFKNTIRYPRDFEGSLQMIYLLTTNGVRILHHEQYLDQLQRPDATEKHQDLYSWMCNCSNSPLTLQEMCRLRVRQQCKIDILQGMRTLMETLDLPVTVKNYLQFDEIWNEMKKYWNFCRLCESITYRFNSESVCKCQRDLTGGDDSDSDLSIANGFESESENPQDTDEEEAYNDLQWKTNEPLRCKPINSADHN